MMITITGICESASHISSPPSTNISPKPPVISPWKNVIAGEGGVMTITLFFKNNVIIITILLIMNNIFIIIILVIRKTSTGVVMNQSA